MKLQFIAIAALAVTSSVSAQSKQNSAPMQVQEMKQPEQLVQQTLPRAEVDGVLKSGGTARALGCVSHQVYNIQGLNLISTGFVLTTSSGAQTSCAAQPDRASGRPIRKLRRSMLNA